MLYDATVMQGDALTGSPTMLAAVRFLDARASRIYLGIDAERVGAVERFGQAKS